jgi:hypothetical protein
MEVRVKMRSVSASDFPPGGAARGGRSQRQRVTAEEDDQEDQAMLDDHVNSSITLVDLQSNSLSALPQHVLLLGESHALATSPSAFAPPPPLEWLTNDSWVISFGDDAFQRHSEGVNIK